MATHEFIPLPIRAGAGFINLSGKLHGWLMPLTPFRRADQAASKVYWLCRCHCGRLAYIQRQCLRRGTRTCGCRMKVSKQWRHGKYNTPTYKAWGAMKKRCDDPQNGAWRHYGGRGISYDPRWKDFTNFLADMGMRPAPNDELDRINNNGNYCKENCRWVTRQQNLNNTRVNHVVVYNGQQMTASELARQVGLRPNRLLARLRAGFTLERAISMPLMRTGRGAK